MAWFQDSVVVLKDLVVGGGTYQKPSQQKAIGAGNDLLQGSCDIDGVVHVGEETFDKGEATLMVAKSRQQQGTATVILRDPESLNVLVAEGGTQETVLIKGTEAPNALVVEGHQTINNGTLHTSHLTVNTFAGLVGTGFVGTGSVINVQGWKGFDIEHPTEKGYRLRHVCLEGPEGAIYTRGRCRNKKEIVLPEYWKDLVHTDSITVQLQPIGSHQDIIVKRWDAEKIYLQSNGGMPIDCFYHVYGERKDGEKLITEYPGESPEDYPGDNNQYSIAGYHYDRRTL